MRLDLEGLLKRQTQNHKSTRSVRKAVNLDANHDLNARSCELNTQNDKSTKLLQQIKIQSKICLH